MCMKSHGVFDCGLCGSQDLEPVLDLGSSPPTCVMRRSTRQAEESHHPLELLVCRACTLAQLSVIVDPEVVFPVDYPYSSGNSRALHEDFEDLARRRTRSSGLSDDLVVDIGANDGTLLSKFPDCRKVGVEPTKQAQPDRRPGVQEFFTEDAGSADRGGARSGEGRHGLQCPRSRRRHPRRDARHRRPARR